MENEKYTLHCFGCGSTNTLEMIAHRNGDKMVGWIFVCSDCVEGLASREMEWVDKDAQDKEVKKAVDWACTCGNKGNNRLECCDACDVWHNYKGKTKNGN